MVWVWVSRRGRPVKDEVERLEAYVHETLLQGEGQTDGKYVQVR